LLPHSTFVVRYSIFDILFLLQAMSQPIAAISWFLSRNALFAGLRPQGALECGSEAAAFK
jgi:hypothetical protein